MTNRVTHLECSLCSKRFEAGKIHNLCDCSGPLLVKYDLDALRHTWTPEALLHGPKTMWRYAPVLPPVNVSSIISLGERMTPLVHTPRLGKRVGADPLRMKDLTPPARSKPEAFPAPFPWPANWASRNWLSRRPGMRPARSPPMPRRRALKPTSICRRTSPSLTS